MKNYLIFILILIFNFQSRSFINAAQRSNNYTPQSYIQPIDSLKDEEGYYLFRNFEYEREVFNGDISHTEAHKGLIHINKPEMIAKLSQIPIGDSEQGSLREAYFVITKPDGRKIFLNKEQLASINGKDYQLYHFRWSEVAVGDQVEYFIKFSVYYNSYKIVGLLTELPILTSKVTLKNAIDFPVVFKIDGIKQTPKHNVLDDKTELYTYEFHNLPKSKRESNAHVRAQMWAVSYYALNDYNNAAVMSWDGYSNKIMTYIEDYKKNSMVIKKFIAQIPIKKNMVNAQKIATIDEYIKSQLLDNKVNTKSPLLSLDSAYSLKQLNYLQKKAIYSAIFDHYNIDHEIVLVTKRFNKPIDPNFPLFKFIDDVAIYIPSVNQYIFDNEASNRVPYIPYYYEQTNAIHIKQQLVNGKASYYATFKQLPQTDALYTKVILNLDIDIKDDQWSAKHHMISTGHYNNDIANYYTDNKVNWSAQSLFLKPFALDKYTDSMLFTSFSHNFKGKVNGKDVIEHKVMSQGKYTTDQDQKIYIPVGKLIGEQAFLTSENERLYDINLAYRHLFIRIIKLKIPEGYQVKNLKDFEMNYQFDDLKFGFTSKALIQSGVLIITIDENYDSLNIDKRYIKPFEQVMNSAYLFSQRYVILEKI